MLNLDLSYAESRIDMRVGECYKIIKKVGSGAFGEIYKGNKDIKSSIIIFFRINKPPTYIGQNTHSGDDVAIKLEPSSTKYPQLYYEAKLYKVFDGAGNSY